MSNESSSLLSERLVAAVTNVVGTLFVFKYIPIHEQLSTLIKLSSLNRSLRRELENNLYWKDFFDGYIATSGRRRRISRQTFFDAVFRQTKDSGSKLATPLVYAVIAWTIWRENSSWSDHQNVTTTKVVGVFAKRRRAMRYRVSHAMRWERENAGYGYRAEYSGTTVIPFVLRTPLDLPMRARKRYCDMFISTSSLGCSEQIDPEVYLDSDDDEHGNPKILDLNRHVRPYARRNVQYILQACDDDTRPLCIPVLSRDDTTVCGGTYDQRIYWVRVKYRY
jgi:hypothetical protein